MRYSRKKGILFEFELRAIDSKIQSLCLSGIVRMNASELPYRVRGLCHNFTLDCSDLTLSNLAYPITAFSIGKEQLFFYGSEIDLNQNHFGQTPSELLSFPLKTSYFKLPLYTFPFSLMKLGPARKELVEELLREANSKLPGWLIEERIKVELNLEGKMDCIKFNRQFYDFPEEWRQAALERGNYYVLNSLKSGKRLG
jgi:hypothetical protein